MRKQITLEERTEAIRAGVAAALREHALLGFSVPVHRDGNIVWRTPAEILESQRDDKGPSEPQ